MNRNGIFVPVNDLDALVEAMRYMYIILINLTENRLQEKLEIFYSPNAIAKKLSDVYEKVVSGGKIF